MVVSEAGIGFDKEGLLARIPSKPISKLVREAREAAGYSAFTAAEAAAQVPEAAWRSEYSVIAAAADSGTGAGGGGGGGGGGGNTVVLRATPIGPSGHARAEPVELEVAAPTVDSDDDDDDDSGDGDGGERQTGEAVAAAAGGRAGAASVPAAVAVDAAAASGRPSSRSSSSGGDGGGCWELVLERGSPIVEIHIPEGSAMDVQTCGDGKY
jgi:hypothetical protein